MDGIPAGILSILLEFLESVGFLQNQWRSGKYCIFSLIYILTLMLIMPTHLSPHLFEGPRKSTLTLSVISCLCVLHIYRQFYLSPIALGLMMTSSLPLFSLASSMLATILANWCRKTQKTFLIGKRSSSVPPSPFLKDRLSITSLITRRICFTMVLTSCSHNRRFLTLSHFSMSMLSNTTLFTMPTLLSSYGRMAPILLAQGLMLAFLPCSVMNLVGTHLVKVVPHFMQTLASLRM